MIVLASDYVGLRTVEHLIEGGYAVDAVVIDPSDRGGFNPEIGRVVKRAGRGIRLRSAEELGRPEFLDALAAASPRLGILAWWPRILKGRILSVPSMGWLNFHPSLLPDNRGKNPNFWCLADTTPCGVSLHFIDEGVDTGPVVAHAQVDVGWEDTGETVYLKCRERIVKLFRESVDGVLSGDLVPIDQDLSSGSSHKAADMAAASIIDLDAPTTARRVLNLIRAKMFDPYPTARFRDGGKTYSVQIVIREVAKP